MKILFITPDINLSGPVNGTSLIINAFLRQFSVRGTDVVHVSRIKTTKGFLRLLSYIISPIFPYSYVPHLFGSIIFFFSRKTLEYDRIIVFREDLLPLAILLSVFKNTSIIFYPIDLFSILYHTQFKSTSNLFLKSLYLSQILISRLWEYVCLCMSIPHIYVSSKDAHQASLLCSSAHTFCIPNGVEILPIIPRKVSCDPVIRLLFSGDFNYRPNKLALNFIIDQLFPLLQELDFHVQFTVIGRGVVPSLLHSSSCSLNIIGNVDSFEPFFLDADIYVSPLFTGAGIKNKILTAFSYGLPVVGSDISFDGLSEFHDRLHFYKCSTNNPRDWINAVYFLWNRPNLRSSFSLKSRSLVHQFYSWENSHTSLIKILYHGS